MSEVKEVWVFSGLKARFPSAIFVAKPDALDWIGNYKLTGTLTKYLWGFRSMSGRLKAKISN
ncbi:hypothetical protein [Variovorax sp. SG517]|uniref:DUF7710 domain-containing protein n=1 Tax=unclassified Variovorax TaxID=663243 RepID=UPI00159CF8C2|nr:hypothetical protein [Variovorax sp. SG517]NVM92471.1 hypothetical protein [Variovorax sp. SG517]